MAHLYQLVYGSTVTWPLNQQEVLGLLQQSHAKNEQLGITGVLLYRDRCFVQVLEGDPDAVRRLFATIQRDDRHQDVQTILEREVQHREFARWEMGFDAVSTPLGDGPPIDWEKIPGYSRFLDDEVTMQQHKRLAFNYSPAYEALLAFKDGQLIIDRHPRTG